MKVVGIIPARLESTRLPRKILRDICGVPMIIHVLKRSALCQNLDDLIVATDSEEIANTVIQYGGKARMTSSSHETGTDRIAEVAKDLDCDIVVNIQGDEALIYPEQIDASIETLKANPDARVVLPVTYFRQYESDSDIKAVLDEKKRMLYMSRADIPSRARTDNPPLWKACHVVSFRRDFLLEFASWGKGELEKIEYIEYLRVLEKGYPIHSVVLKAADISVDTERDLDIVREKMLKDDLFMHYSKVAKGINS